MKIKITDKKGVNVNPDMIGAIGFSAGGIYAECYQQCSTNPWLKKSLARKPNFVN